MKKPTVYINRTAPGQPQETVDQFDTWKEARAMVREYRLADPSGNYYLSRRACKAWNE